MRYIFLFVFLSSPTYAQKEKTFSIYFANDSAVINIKERSKLDSISKEYSKDSVQVLLNGYANNFGSTSHNLKLAQSRLDAVVKELSHFTIDSTRAIGELPTPSWRARRVDVVLKREEEIVLDSTLVKVNESEEEGNKRRMVSSRTLDIVSYSELEINETTVLFGIFFKGGTDKMLGSSSIITLNNVVRFLEMYPDRRILITGHICCSEGRNPEVDGYNNRNGSSTLSLDRAKAVYNYLIKKGITSKRLRYQGKAYLEPLDWEEIKNRRVEMTILE